MANFLLKVIIFVLLWVGGVYFFSGFGGAIGMYGSMAFIGKSIIGSDLTSDVDDLATTIMAFIITAAVYYIVAEIITYLLLKLFGRSEK